MSTIFSIAIMPAMAFGSPHHGHQQVAYYPAPQPHRVIERVVYRPVVQERIVYRTQYGHDRGHKRGHWQGRGHGRDHHETRISYRDRW